MWKVIVAILILVILAVIAVIVNFKDCCCYCFPNDNAVLGIMKILF